MLELSAVLNARAPSAMAGWRAGQPVSHQAFLQRVGAWRALAARTPGSKVALYLDDSLEFGAALLGAWQAGKTVWLSADTLDASCRALAPRVDAFFGAFPAPWAGLAPGAADSAMPPLAPLAADFPALVVHTSGSTGAPQAIAKQLGQLTREVATLEGLFGAALGACDVIATVSHQHIYGLLFKVLWPLAAGRPIHALSLDYPEQLAHELAQRPCLLVASPAHLKRLPAHLDWIGAAAMLRMVFSSGGALAPEAAAAAGRLLGHAPTEIYGSSESGGIAWRQRRPGCAGAWQPLPGVEWRAAGSSGQLELRSPHLASHDWLRMDDRIEATAAGSFFLSGRVDRLVKIEEKRISLDAMEAALAGCGLAREARLVPLPAAGELRQSLAAFVVLSDTGRAMLAADGKDALNRRLRAQLAQVVEAVALPRRWRYLDALPLNPQGKTTAALLLALLGKLPDARPRTPLIELIEQDGARVLLGLTVPASLLYFDGHFRHAPVLPGVVQVDWAIAQGRRYFALGPGFKGIHALKFQMVIGPEAPLFLELIHDSVSGALQFRYFSDAGPHAGGRIMFGPL